MRDELRVAQQVLESRKGHGCHAPQAQAKINQHSSLVFTQLLQGYQLSHQKPLGQQALV